MSTLDDPIPDNIARVRERIAEAAVRAGRAPAEITLCGVTKTISAERVIAAARAGVQVFGENYVQEARTKIPKYNELAQNQTLVPVTWHLIGHLQSNKAKYSVSLFSCIHSVDNEGLIEEIGKQSLKIGKEQEVLIEIDLSGAEGRTGVAPDALGALIEKVLATPGVALRGLMGMAPYGTGPEEARPHFRRLRRFFDTTLPPECRRILSMGMSGDYAVAVEEGSTLVRIGTAIFGPRNIGSG